MILYSKPDDKSTCSSALCSLSTGRSLASDLLNIDINISPAATKISLLAMMTVLFVLKASIVGLRHSKPTIAATTISTSSWDEISFRPSSPNKILVKLISLPYSFRNSLYFSWLLSLTCDNHFTWIGFNCPLRCASAMSQQWLMYFLF